MTQPLSPPGQPPARPAPNLVALQPPERAMPWHALDAEAAVIAAVMLENEQLAVVQDIVQAKYFFSAPHRYIWEAILELASRGQPFDAVTIAEELRRRDKLTAVGGVPFLAHVVDSTPAVANVEDHALIVRQAWQLRELGSVAEKIAVYTRRHVGNVTETLARAEQAVLAITQIGSGKSEGAHIGDAIRSAFERIEAIGRNQGQLAGLSTGLRAIDAMTAGVGEVDLFVLGARPGVGKTSLAGNIAVNVAAGGGGVQFFSYELLREQLVTRMVCAEAYVDSLRMRKGLLSAEDWGRLTQAAQWQRTLPIWIDDDSSLTVFDIKARVVRRAQACERAGTPLRLVVVDYLQMVKPPATGQVRTREQEVAEVARELKRLAKAIRVPIIALGALSRDSEKQNRRPRMSDLRESGNIESDTDTAAFLFVDKDTPEGCTSMHFDKNRNGRTGTVHLAFQKEFSRFNDYAGADGSEERG